MPIITEIIDQVLVLTVDNPPVNALSQVERSELLTYIEHGKADNVSAIVIAGNGGSFIAGADIKEFGKPSLPPHLPDVISAIEAFDKPVIAAIAGQALGAGLEVALGCHFRVASATARLGLPEVTLGIVPGAGGTQRLPRLIGPLTAAKMICEGKHIGAQVALGQGLVDCVVTGDPVPEAIKLAKEVASVDLETRRLSRRPAIWDAETHQGLAKLREEYVARSRGARAPGAAASLVVLAGQESFGSASIQERQTFLELRASPEAAAMRHIFFAERIAAKLPDGLGNVKARPVELAGVIGAGTMGTGIAMSIVDAGIPVVLVERSDEALQQGLERIAAAYQLYVKRGRIDEGEAGRRTAKIMGSVDYRALSTVDLIIEAAFESIPVKREIFQRLSTVAKPGAVLATNTSYLDVNEIAAATPHPEDVVGLHYFSPANVMALLEVVKAEKTAPDVLATALAFAKKTGKKPVIAGVCHGFIGNRMMRAYNREAGLLLLDGASVEQVDDVLMEFGMAMGPFAVADLSGIDIGYKGRKEMTPGSFEPAATRVHDGLVELGQLGQKTRAGFYKYAEGGKRQAHNPVVDELVAKAQAEFGVTSRVVEKSEIIERCIYALANEAMWIVGEGIAARLSDTDVVYVNGYGFPRHRGGPAFYASQVGYTAVLEAVTSFRAGPFGRWWEPARELTLGGANDAGGVRRLGEEIVG